MWINIFKSANLDASWLKFISFFLEFMVKTSINVNTANHTTWGKWKEDIENCVSKHIHFECLETQNMSILMLYCIYSAYISMCNQIHKIFSDFFILCYCWFHSSRVSSNNVISYIELKFCRDQRILVGYI